MKFTPISSTLATESPNPNGHATVGHGSVPLASELAVTDRVLSRSKADLLWTKGEGFHLWDGRRFLRDETETVYGLAQGVVRGIYGEAATALTDIANGSKEARKTAEAEADRLYKLARSVSQRARIKGALDNTRSHVAVMTDALDSQPHLLNCRNGTVDLNSGELRPHSRADRISKLVDIDYYPEATVEPWEKFLFEIFAGDTELILFVQRSVGYSLTADQREKVFWFCWGPSDTGKTTFLSVLLAILGDYGQKVPRSLFLRDYDRIPSDRAQLRGIRFAYASETAKGKSFDSEKLKELTGHEGQLSARHMYAEEFRFTPTHHLWLASNYKPYAAPDDGALWNRLRLIPFTVIFTEPTEENPEPEHPMDKQLEAKLLEEREGILAWAVKGALDWRNHGLREPKCVREAGKTYQTEEDTVQHFITQCTEKCSGTNTKQSEMYRAYSYFMEGERGRMGKQKFNDALERQYGFEPAHDRADGNIWLNVELKEGALPPLKGDEAK